MIARGDRPNSRRLPACDCSTRSTSGAPKAMVLPEPVRPRARTSRPASTAGMLAAWIGNGVAAPMPTRVSTMFDPSPRSPKVTPSTSTAATDFASRRSCTTSSPGANFAPVEAGRLVAFQSLRLGRSLRAGRPGCRRSAGAGARCGRRHRSTDANARRGHPRTNAACGRGRRHGVRGRRRKSAQGARRHGRSTGSGRRHGRRDADARRGRTADDRHRGRCRTGAISTAVVGEPGTLGATSIVATRTPTIAVVVVAEALTLGAGTAVVTTRAVIAVEPGRSPPRSSR